MKRSSLADKAIHPQLKVGYRYSMSRHVSEQHATAAVGSDALLTVVERN